MPSSATAHTHSFSDWHTVCDAGCDYNGSRERSCSCGYKETSEISATGHRWSNWNTVTSATFEAAGSETRSCSVCGKAESRVIPVKVLSAAEKRAMAHEVAKQIASSITGDTDLDKVGQAAYIVSTYCNKANYTMEGKDYCEAYGVFIKGEYSCAGATRALGMILECMGYKI